MAVVYTDLEQITSEHIKAMVVAHKSAVTRYVMLQEYYEGRHNILYRQYQDTNKPNNKIVNNFPGYIVDVNVGYFLGEPVSYTSSDEGMVHSLQEIFDANDEQDQNIELGKAAAIKGHAFELLYMDEEAQVRFGRVPPDSMIVIYNNNIEPNIIGAIRYWPIEDTIEEGEAGDEEREYHVEFYDARDRVTYRMKGESLLLIGEEDHPFQDVPVVEYKNNEERQGDFEKVLTEVDAYDKAQSDTANDLEYFADAYLKIRNMSGTQDSDVDSMKRNRVILVDSDGDADWLTKQINDTVQENYKERLQEDIHRFSKTPNLSDEKFAGNVSGVALRFKLWGLEQNASQKERKFKKALQRRIELICNVLEIKGTAYEWTDAQITFSRNIPAVLPEIVEMVAKLRGTVSRKTLLSQLPFIEDPALEEELLEAEEGDRIDIDTYGLTPAIPIGAAGEADAEEE